MPIYISRGIEEIQNKVINIIKFEINSLNLNNLYNKLSVMKFKDLVTLNSSLFVFDRLNGNLLDGIENYF